MAWTAYTRRVIDGDGRAQQCWLFSKSDGEMLAHSCSSAELQNAMSADSASSSSLCSSSSTDTSTSSPTSEEVTALLTRFESGDRAGGELVFLQRHWLNVFHDADVVHVRERPQHVASMTSESMCLVAAHSARCMIVAIGCSADGVKVRSNVYDLVATLRAGNY